MAADELRPTTFEMQVSEIEKLPILGTLNTSKLPKEETIKLPEAFVGQSLVASLRIKNSSDGELRVESVTTSCGCMAVFVSEAPVAPGESSPFLVKLNYRESGVFRNSLHIQTNQGLVQVNLSGNVQHRVALTQTDIPVEKSASSIRLTLAIHDRSIDAKLLELLPSVGTNVMLHAVSEAGERTYKVEIDPADELPSTMSIAVRRAGKEIVTLHARLVSLGVLRVSPENVYVTQRDEAFHFRLFLSGDVGAIDMDSTEASIDFLDMHAPNEVVLSHKTHIQMKTFRHSILASVSMDAEANLNQLELSSRPVRVRVGTHAFDFKLSRR